MGQIIGVVRTRRTEHSLKSPETSFLCKSGKYKAYAYRLLLEEILH